MVVQAILQLISQIACKAIYEDRFAQRRGFGPARAAFGGAPDALSGLKAFQL